MGDKAILFDAIRCIACRGCQGACKQWNENDEEIPREENAVHSVNWGSHENPPDLSPQTWLRIRFTEVEREGRVDWLFTRHSCMHCTEAACVEVCPSGALYHHEDGFVAYDKEVCIGCGYCSQYCPFDIPRLDAGRIVGIGKMDKCTLCTTPGLDRLSIGQEPACVKACPTGALEFGEREQLVAEGRRRVSMLRQGSSRAYPRATLYGETELGGLHVLYVLDDSPEVYGLPARPLFPITATIQESIFRPVTWILWGVAAAGLALNVLVARIRQNSGGKQPL